MVQPVNASHRRRRSSVPLQTRTSARCRSCTSVIIRRFIKRRLSRSRRHRSPILCVASVRRGSKICQTRCSAAPEGIPHNGCASHSVRCRQAWSGLTELRAGRLVDKSNDAVGGGSLRAQRAGMSVSRMTVTTAPPPLCGSHLFGVVRTASFNADRRQSEDGGSSSHKVRQSGPGGKTPTELFPSRASIRVDGRYAGPSNCSAATRRATARAAAARCWQVGSALMDTAPNLAGSAERVQIGRRHRVQQVNVGPKGRIE